MKRLVIYIVIGALALLLGVALNLGLQSDGSSLAKRLVKLESGTALTGQERPVVDFQMTDKDGQPFTQEQFKGQWNYVFFGFTSCGYICPTTLKTLADAIRLLEEKQQAADVQGVFISTDPDRDTVAKIKTYVEGFHPGLQGIRGENEDLTKLTRQLGILFVKTDNPEDPENYDMDHSAQILVINPEGEYAAVLSPPHTPEALAKDMITLKKAH